MTSHGKIELEQTEVNEQEQYRKMRNLWAAKMMKHIEDYREGINMMHRGRSKVSYKNRLSKKDNFNTALDWIKSRDDKIATFVWVCYVLDLDVERTRNEILSYGGAVF